MLMLLTKYKLTQFGLLQLFLEPNEDLSSILHFDKQFLIDLCVQLIATMIIVFILYKLLYKPVLNVLQKRKERIGRELGEAENALSEAKKLKTDYESRLVNIETERGEILEAAHKRAVERENQIIAQAKNEAELIISRAKLEVEREKEKVKDDVKKQIIEVSSLMASRFVVSVIDNNTQNKLLNEVISDLGDLEWLS